MINRELVIAAVILLALSLSVSAKFGDKITVKEKDMMRKSIVFDKKTPDVFYCPMQKPSTMNKLIVRSRPLHKLCEYEGQPLPDDYKSDCYQDMDESDYACKEKYRIMEYCSSSGIYSCSQMRKFPPGSEAPYNGTRLQRFMDLDSEVRAKMEKVSKTLDFHDVVIKY